jgi:FtsH-binding integral membrane protein
MGFLRKVYGLLSVQLLMTTLIAAVCIFSPAVKGLIHTNPWLILLVPDFTNLLFGRKVFG